METRDTPAQFYWCPDEYPSAWDKNDWRTLPSATSPIPAQPPTSGDVLYFTNLASNADCPLIPLPSWWNPDGSPGGTVPQVGNFYGVQLTDSYSGVVDFKCSAFVGGLSVGSPVGTVRQSDPNFSTHGGQITVQMALSWTGGTLNDSSLPGFLNLAPMARGTIAPTNSGTVNLGSTVTLLGHPYAPIASTLSAYSGTINLNKGDGFQVKDGSQINFWLRADPTGKLVINDTQETPPANGLVDIDKKSSANVKSVDRSMQSAENPGILVLKNSNGKEATFTNSGKTKIQDYCVLDINPGSAKDGTYYQKKAAAADDAPTTTLEAGSQIRCNGKGMVMIRHGELHIVNILGGDGKPLADQGEAVIASGGDPGGLAIYEDGALVMASGVYNKLRVKGRLKMQGGLQMRLSRVSDRCDQIFVEGGATFDDDTAKLTLSWYGDGALPGADTKWELVTVEGDNNLISGAPKDPRITYPADGDNTNMEVKRDATDKKLLARMK